MRQHKLPRKRRLELVREQFGRCAYCGRLMTTNSRHRLDDNYATGDHVEAQSQEVRPKLDRVYVAACLRCNLLKADTSLIVFLAKLARQRDNEGDEGAPSKGALSVCLHLDRALARRWHRAPPSELPRAATSGPPDKSSRQNAP